MTLKLCAVCRNERLYAHCNSRTCDLVQCGTCENIGSLDGRWWPIAAVLRSHPTFGDLLRSISALRKDLGEESGSDLP